MHLRLLRFFIFCFLCLLSVAVVGEVPADDLFHTVKKNPHTALFYRQGERLGLSETIALLDSLYPPEKRKDPRQNILYLHYMAEKLFQLKEVELAMQANEEELEVLSRYNDRRMLAEARFIRGDLLIYVQDYASAFEYFFSALQLVENDREPMLRASFDYRIGHILYKQGQFQEARHSFLQSLELSKCCDTAYHVALKVQELMGNIGLCYLQQDSVNEALDWFNRAEVYALEIQGRTELERQVVASALAVIKGNMGSAWLQLGDTAKATLFYKESLAKNLELPFEKVDAVIMLGRIAHLYIAGGDYQQASLALDQMDSLIQRYRFQQHRIDYYRCKSLLMEKKGYQDSALYYARLLSEAEALKVDKERFLTQNNIKQLLRLRESKEALGILQRSRNRNSVFIFLTVSLIMVLLIALGMGIWSYRTLAVKNKELEDLNFAFKEANFDLQEALRDLKVTTQQKDRILAIVAHDLRNPLNAIASISKLLQGPDGQAEAQRTQWLDMVQQACVSSMELIEEILLMSEVQVDAGGKFRKTIDVAKLTEDCIQVLRFRAKEKQQFLQWVVQPGTVLPVWADESRLRRCVSNLVTNAIKFSPEHAVIIVSAREERGMAMIEVADRGIGIPATLLADIFQEFSPSKRQGTNGEQAYGLGLSIVKRIVEAHEGRIEVSSEEGKGSTFRIYLPLHQA